MAYEQVEIAACRSPPSVSDRRADGTNAGHSFVLRGYVRTWMRNISAEFDRIGLPQLLEDRSAQQG